MTGNTRSRWPDARSGPKEPPGRLNAHPTRPGDGGSAPAPEAQPAPDTDLPRVYTPAEAAEVLGVRESWLRRQAGQRHIPCTLLGRRLRFSAADLHEIVAAAKRAPRRATRRRP